MPAYEAEGAPLHSLLQLLTTMAIAAGLGYVRPGADTATRRVSVSCICVSLYARLLNLITLSACTEVARQLVGCCTEGKGGTSLQQQGLHPQRRFGREGGGEEQLRQKEEGDGWGDYTAAHLLFGIRASQPRSFYRRRLQCRSGHETSWTAAQISNGFDHSSRRWPVAATPLRRRRQKSTVIWL